MSFEKRRAQLMASCPELFPVNTLQPASPTVNHNKPFNCAVGTTFRDRKELYQKGVHNRQVAGISGSAKTGAVSIVVSGKYEDDYDNGDTIIYTGTGGQRDAYNDPGAQIADQTFDHFMNKALQVSCEQKKPVRVVRGSDSDSKYAPFEGYRYDGLYEVTRTYYDKGRSGFLVCRFELKRLPGQPPIPVRRWAH